MTIEKAKYVKTNQSFKTVQTPLNLKPLPVPKDIDFGLDETGTLEKIWFLVKNFPKIINVLYEILKIYVGVKIMSQSTLDTIKGIIRALAMVVAIFGINISPENVNTIVTAVGSVWAVVELIMGYFSGGKNVPKT